MPECCCHEEGPLYLKRALSNVLFSAPLIILNIFGLIPSPLTPIGCLIGLGLAGISLFVMAYSGGEYYKSAWLALKKKKTNMHSLVALSTIIAFVYSVALCILPRFFPLLAIHYHFSEIGMILGVVNLGRWQRAKAEDQINKKTQNYFNILSKYQCTVARRYRTQMTQETIKVDEIEVGDILEVRPGERFPVEGVIVSISSNHSSWIDQKNITGESQLVKKEVGDSVLTGTLNKTHVILIRSTVRGVDNNLKKLLTILQKRQKAVDSELINKITQYFIPIIILIALITALSWLYLNPITIATFSLMIQSVMSVLLCACPCALGLAVPMSTSISIDKLSEEGILIKNASSFEKARRIDICIFDKTGTLTEPFVETRYFPDLILGEQAILNYVASLEKYHEKSHPIAKALINTASHFYTVTQPITEAQGMKGFIQGASIMVGSLEYCLKQGAKVDDHYIQKAQALNQIGQTAVFVVYQTDCVGVLGLKHQLHPDAKRSIEALKAKGITLGLLTGDKKGPAQAIAQALGIDPNWVWSEQSAEQKQQKIKLLKKQFKGIAMVGDGMNDILACKEADISFAIHAWANAAVKCDVALQGSIEGIVKFLEVSDIVVDNIKLSLGWTFAYNIIAIMSATGLLYPILSCALNPILATALMACSSLVVILNAQRLPNLINQVLHKKEHKKESVIRQPPSLSIHLTSQSSLAARTFLRDNRARAVLPGFSNSALKGK